MGKTQSKRSVDITTTETNKTMASKDPEFPDKMEKIDDTIQQKEVVNGDTIMTEKLNREKQDGVDLKNGGKDMTSESKDLTIGGVVTNSIHSDGKGEDVQAAGDTGVVKEIAVTPDSQETGVEHASKTPGEGGENIAEGDSVKKSKTEKVKKKWTFRSISFGRKDKQKPVKNEETPTENVNTVVTNGIPDEKGSPTTTNKDNEETTTPVVTEDNGKTASTSLTDNDIQKDQLKSSDQEEKIPAPLKQNNDEEMKSEEEKEKENGMPEEVKIADKVMISAQKMDNIAISMTSGHREDVETMAKNDTLPVLANQTAEAEPEKNISKLENVITSTTAVAVDYNHANNVMANDVEKKVEVACGVVSVLKEDEATEVNITNEGKMSNDVDNNVHMQNGDGNMDNCQEINNKDIPAISANEVMDDAMNPMKNQTNEITPQQQLNGIASNEVEESDQMDSEKFNAKQNNENKDRENLTKEPDPLKWSWSSSSVDSMNEKLQKCQNNMIEKESNLMEYQMKSVEQPVALTAKVTFTVDELMEDMLKSSDNQTNPPDDKVNDQRGEKIGQLQSPPSLTDIAEKSLNLEKSNEKNDLELSEKSEGKAIDGIITGEQIFKEDVKLVEEKDMKQLSQIKTYMENDNVPNMDKQNDICKDSALIKNKSEEESVLSSAIPVVGVNDEYMEKLKDVLDEEAKEEDICAKLDPTITSKSSEPAEKEATGFIDGNLEVSEKMSEELKLPKLEVPYSSEDAVGDKADNDEQMVKDIADELIGNITEKAVEMVTIISMEEGSVEKELMGSEKKGGINVESNEKEDDHLDGRKIKTSVEKEAEGNKQEFSYPEPEERKETSVNAATTAFAAATETAAAVGADADNEKKAFGGDKMMSSDTDNPTQQLVHH